MRQFASETRMWLESVIRQREMLMIINKSHKPQSDVQMALYRLVLHLNANPYALDLHMARFVRQFGNDIDTILPGKGSSCHESKQREWERIRKSALLIEESKPIKNTAYEIQF
jgi:hypothetical protein